MRERQSGVNQVGDVAVTSAQERPRVLPKGRTVLEFSPLKPSEERLLAAVREGTVCDLADTQRVRELRQILIGAKSDDAFRSLALEVMRMAEPVVRYREYRIPEHIKGRADVEPTILREVLAELPGFADGHPAASRGATDEDGAASQIITALLELFEREVEMDGGYGWRAVERDGDAVEVRAGVLRVLALGGDAAHPVHEKGVQLCGARITGKLDLEGTAVVPLKCTGCWFDETPNLSRTKLTGLSLTGSRIPGLNANAARVDAGLDFDLGFRSDGQVLLPAVEIGGDLNCHAGKLRNRTEDGKGQALNAMGARIAGKVAFCHGFSAEGEVKLLGAQIGGALYCHDGAFRNRTISGEGTALHASAARIGSEVSLCHGFLTEGVVRFTGAQIGDNFVCQGSTFDNLIQSTSDSREAAMALALDSARVDGTLIIQSIIRGSVRLSDTHAHYLSDLLPPTRQPPDQKDRAPQNREMDTDVAEGGWPIHRQRSADGTILSCNAVLDNFTYDFFAGDAPVDLSRASNGLPYSLLITKEWASVPNLTNSSSRCYEKWGMSALPERSPRRAKTENFGLVCSEFGSVGACFCSRSQ